jgi:hypothetical protein
MPRAPHVAPVLGPHQREIFGAPEQLTGRQQNPRGGKKGPRSGSVLTAQGKPGLCVVCLPAIRAFQRHSTQHLLRYRSPFGFHFCFRSVPSGFVQRIGCGACGLGYPHQVWLVGSLPPCAYPVPGPGELHRSPNQMPPLHWHDLGFRPGPPPCRFLAWPFTRRFGI